MKQLIKHLKRQKKGAQQKVFELYADYLFRVCYRYLKNRESAEDALSQAFIKIFNSVKEVDITEENKFKAWIKRIAINEALMIIRSNINFSQQIELTEINEKTENNSEMNLITDDLINMVMNLPIGYRTVFSLYVIEGYKHSEISEQLNISVGTSKSQLSKAKKMLQQMINEETTRSNNAIKG